MIGYLWDRLGEQSSHNASLALLAVFAAGPPAWVCALATVVAASVILRAEPGSK